MMDPKVLIIEDEPVLLDYDALVFDQIPLDQRRRLGVGKFAVKKAVCAAEGKHLLEGAASGTPFDLLLLDLGLPDGRGGHPSPNVGLSVLEMALATGAAKEVIVCSVFSDYQLFTENSHRGGSVQFVAKGVETQGLQIAILRGWHRVLSKESSSILAQRVRDLFPYAQKGLAYQLGTCFLGLAQSVQNGLEEMPSKLAGSLGSGFTSEHQSCMADYLRSMREAVDDAKRGWRQLQAAIAPAEEAHVGVVVEEVLAEVAEYLLPCLTIEGVRLEIAKGGRTRVLTFGHDVRTVLREIVAGGLTGIGDYNRRPSTIEIHIGMTGNQAEVRFKDTLGPISPESCDSINRGVALIPCEGFGREWGLSIAQHLALLGGGRLVLDSIKGGAAITYLIPLAQDE